MSEPGTTENVREELRELVSKMKQTGDAMKLQEATGQPVCGLPYLAFWAWAQTIKEKCEKLGLDYGEEMKLATTEVLK